MLAHFIPRLAAENPKFADLATNPTPRLYDDAFHLVLSRWGGDEWQAPDVERVGDFVARVRHALDRAIRAAGAGARIAAITSAGPIGVAFGLVAELPPARMLRTSVVVRNASISELQFRSAGFDWQPEQLSLVTFNTTGHLPPELVSER
jgi:broad specificity phosphatase PhoE